MTPVVAALPFILPGTGYEAYDPAKGIYPVGHYIRTAGYAYGWDWGPKLVTMGIWRPVHLEAWDDARIVGVHIEQNSVTAERALLTANVDVEAPAAAKINLDLDLSSIGAAMGAEVGVHGAETLEAGINHLKYSLRIEHPRRWFPAGYGAQDRYGVSVKVKDTSGAQADLGRSRAALKLRMNPFGTYSPPLAARPFIFRSPGAGRGAQRR